MAPDKNQAGSKRRIFFALWPPPAVREAIIERRARLGDPSRRRVPDANLHITLLFLGDQPGERIDRVMEAAGSVRAPGFELVLDRLGWFTRARVAWLGGDPPQAGKSLVERLAGRMEALGLSFDSRPWVPHVTLYRNVGKRPALPEIGPVTWPVSEISLIESIPARPYQVLRTWPLESE